MSSILRTWEGWVCANILLCCGMEPSLDLLGCHQNKAADRKWGGGGEWKKESQRGRKDLQLQIETILQKRNEGYAPHSGVFQIRGWQTMTHPSFCMYRLMGRQTQFIFFFCYLWCFCASEVELSSYDTYRMAQKLKLFTIWSFTEKVYQPLVSNMNKSSASLTCTFDQTSKVTPGISSCFLPTYSPSLKLPVIPPAPLSCYIRPRDGRLCALGATHICAVGYMKGS